jgi:uracil-DNA glycosylase family 4
MWPTASSIACWKFRNNPSKFHAGDFAMDPSKRARVETQIAEWLRYGNDLGLGPFYRDRVPSDAIAAPATAPVGVAAELPAEVISENIRIEETTEMPTSRTPAKAFAASAAASATPVSAPASAVLPIVNDSNLFDSFERVANDSLPRIREDIGDCKRCKLHKGRTKLVFGVGNPKAELMFVGEGPGRDEDQQGEPFVGRAGKLLTQMIEAMSLQRGDVYIANVVKCRPPENRLPEKDEIATCSPFLLRQIEVIKPKVICCLGACSAQTLLQTAQGISKFRGEWLDFRGTKLMATYHPAYLLRNPAAKGEVWKDLQKIMGLLGLKPRKK